MASASSMAGAQEGGTNFRIFVGSVPSSTFLDCNTTQFRSSNTSMRRRLKKNLDKNWPKIAICTFSCMLWMSICKSTRVQICSDSVVRWHVEDTVLNSGLSMFAIICTSSHGSFRRSSVEWKPNLRVHCRFDFTFCQESCLADWQKKLLLMIRYSCYLRNEIHRISFVLY
jgi:hypothetical protein